MMNTYRRSRGQVFKEESVLFYSVFSELTPSLGFQLLQFLVPTAGSIIKPSSFAWSRSRQQQLDLLHPSMHERRLHQPLHRCLLDPRVRHDAIRLRRQHALLDQKIDGRLAPRDVLGRAGREHLDDSEALEDRLQVVWRCPGGRSIGETQDVVAKILVLVLLQAAKSI